LRESSLKKILFSNSSFSEINSNNINGGVAYIRVVTYENVVVENCTFEHCNGASKGGVFYLYGTNPYIYLKNVKFLNNSAIDSVNGNDIFCESSSCLTATGKTIIDDDTCTTSLNSVRLGVKPTDGNVYPDYISFCVSTSCPQYTDGGNCGDKCYVFDKNIFYYLYFLFRYNNTCREECPEKYLANGNRVCEYQCPPPYSGLGFSNICVYSSSEITTPGEVSCYYYEGDGECVNSCPNGYVGFFCLCFFFFFLYFNNIIFKRNLFIYFFT
jgi:hypothetical protein